MFEVVILQYEFGTDHDSMMVLQDGYTNLNIESA